MKLKLMSLFLTLNLTYLSVAHGESLTWAAKGWQEVLARWHDVAESGWGGCVIRVNMAAQICHSTI